MMHTTSIRIAYLAGCLLLIWLALTAGTWGWADLDRLAAERIREAAAKAPADQDTLQSQSWQRSLALVEKARQLAPAKADYALQLGQLYDAAAQRASDAQQRAELALQAEAAYRDSLTLRPSWARAWAHLAARRLAAGGSDPSVVVAMQQAQALGPWEIEVATSLARLAMQSWAGLPPAMQQSAWGHIQRAASRPELQGGLLQWADANGWGTFLRQAMAQPQATGE